jgi:hypothetical protein
LISSLEREEKKKNVSCFTIHRWGIIAAPPELHGIFLNLSGGGRQWRSVFWRVLSPLALVLVVSRRKRPHVPLARAGGEE